MLSLALTVVLAPLAGFVLQFFFGRRLPRQGDWLTVSTIGASFVSSVLVALKALSAGFEPFHWSVDWFNPGGGRPCSSGSSGRTGSSNG